MPRRLKALLPGMSSETAAAVAADLVRAGYAPDCRPVDDTALVTALEEHADAVIAELHGPVAGALRTLQTVRQRDSLVPVIFVYGAGDDALAVAALRAGASDCVRTDSGALGEAVAAALARAEAQRLERDRTDQLEVDSRMAAIARLAGRIAHDLNNHLTVIKGYANLLIETPPGTDSLRRDLHSIEQSATAAEQLTRRLMDCTRPHRWRPAALDLNALIVGCADVLRRILGRDIDLLTTLSDGLWKVEADPDCMSRVLTNLAGNAREAIAGAGRFSIETVNRQGGPAGATFGDAVTMTIGDTGTGMDRQTLLRSFEPFFTTRGDSRAGLGLSVAYGIVRQAGGTMRSYSAPGAGTTFEIMLPRLNEAADVGRAGAGDRSAGDLSA